jgi:Fibronectin type III domain
MVSQRRTFKRFRTILFRLTVVMVPLALIALLGVMAQSPDAEAATVAATAPGAPKGVTAVAGSAQATVSWTAPASNGGSAITSYTVTSVPGGETAAASGTATSATVTGLTNGTAYRFYVTATNAAGKSAPSGSSALITPAAAAVPAAPVITGVLARASAVELAWSVPDTGASGLTGYVITAYSGGSKVTTATEAASATDATVTGLTNGTQYVFTIMATDGTGSSPASPPSPAIAPQPASVPMGPPNVQAFPQAGQIQVSWSAAPDGGSAITGYTVTVTPGTHTVTTVPGTTVTTITGLTNGTAYTASVTATNAAGTGPAAQAAPVTPAASIRPGAPDHLSAAASGKGDVRLQWSPPVTSGTSAVTSYTVTASPGSTTVSSDACSGTPVLCTASMTGLTATTAYTFTATATSSAGTSVASAATASVKPSLVVSQAPVVLSSASVATLRSPGTDGTLIFENPPAQVTGLTANQIIEIGASSAFPDGYLGTVVSTDTQGGYFVVTTTQASLDNLYSTYQSAMNIPFVAASMSSSLPGVSLDRPTRAGKTLAAATTASDGVTVNLQGDSLVIKVQADLLGGDSEQGEDATVGVAPVAELDGSVTLTPTFKYTDDNTFLGLTVGGSATAQVNATLGVQLKAAETLPVGYILGEPIITEFGLVTPELTVSLVLDTDGSVGVTYNATYTASATGTCKVRKSFTSTSGDTCPATASASGTESHGTIYGSMDIKAGVQFGGVLDMEFGAVVAGVTITPAIELKVDTAATPWWQVNIDVGLGVFVKLARGITVYNNDNLIDLPVTIAQASGALAKPYISPPVQAVAPGGTYTFSANTVAGPVTTSDWSVVGGPGSISSGTYTAPATGVGTAVVQAVYDGSTARAGVVLQGLTAPVLDSDTRGLVDALTVSWQAPAAGSTPPDNYEIVACPDTTSVTATYTCVDTTVPSPETYAYLPNLAPGSRYTVSVLAEAGNTATGAATALGTTFPTVTVLAPLPSQVGGTGFNGDIASNNLTGRPDQLGTAGTGGAAVSGNGQYVFFYTEARSNLAPASIFNVGSDVPFLVREDLVTHTIALASVQPGGTPIAALDPESSGGDPGAGGTLVTNESGNAVGFTAIDGEAMVHNFATNVSWQVGNSGPLSGTLALMYGLSDDGTVIGYTAPDGSGTENVWRQVQGGAPQQVGQDCDCFDGSEVSMSGNGNLIAYEIPENTTSLSKSIYLYDATTGTNKDLFPANTAESDVLINPVISDDGSHIALLAQALLATSCTAGCNEGIVVKPLSGATSTTVAPANVLVSNNNYNPISISDSGTTFAYFKFDVGANGQVDIYQGGKSTPIPSLATTYDETAQVTTSGSAVFYTLWYNSADSRSTGSQGENYPGVFEWALG